MVVPSQLLNTDLEIPCALASMYLQSIHSNITWLFSDWKKTGSPVLYTVPGYSATKVCLFIKPALKNIPLPATILGANRVGKPTATFSLDKTFLSARQRIPYFHYDMPGFPTLGAISSKNPNFSKNSGPISFWCFFAAIQLR